MHTIIKAALNSAISKLQEHTHDAVFA